MAVPGSDWRGLPGRATDITIASDGSGYYHHGTNAYCYRWDGGGGWLETGLKSPLIAAGINHEVWYFSTEHLTKVFVRNVLTGAEEEFPGPPINHVMDFAVGANGTAFAIDPGDTGSPGVYFFSRTPKVWTKIDAGSHGWAISGGNGGNPWHIGDEHRIYRWDGAFQQVGGSAYDIGVSSADRAWAIGDGETIHYLEPEGWKGVAGWGKRIDTGPDGYAWVVNNDGEIFRRI